MSKNWALPLYFLFVGFEILRVVLTVFRKWDLKDKIEQEEEMEHREESSSPDSRKKGNIRRRNVARSAKEKRKLLPSSSSTFFSFFDGDLRFMTNMWDRPGLCYHVGTSSCTIHSYRLRPSSEW